jgi:hypothetical protein
MTSLVGQMHKQMEDGGSWNSGWDDDNTWHVQFLTWPGFIPKQVLAQATLSQMDIFDDDDVAAYAFIRGWNDGNFHGWFDNNTGPTTRVISNAREVWFGLTFYGPVHAGGTYTIHIWN